jgi:phosphohistidine phosphatase
MELLIVRHGIAHERSVRRWPEDGERPLTAHGIARARHAAAGFEHLSAAPTRVLTSPLRRAQQTAAILTEVAGWPEAALCRELLPGGSPEALFALLARLRAPRTAVVGHQPELARLLGRCLAANLDAAAFEIRKMGAALVSFPGAPRAGRGQLKWLVPPRALRAAR